MPTPTPHTPTDTDTRTDAEPGPVGAFRVVATIEAATYLVLLSAVVLYRVLDGPDLVGALGPIHGIAFLVYFVLVLRVREGQGWGFWRTILVLVASALPFGGFWAAKNVAPAASGEPSPSRSA